ncbi:DUF2304 family protein [Neobacillus cucumis]|uniref:Uncharacterized protein n=1 Tax=Neobacillus cucumis TaxID=1740721 RepID=A0A2N5H9Y7_9BACI|nr:DUF2304 family protein [Neobacillus cucumis]PLS02333.1 hypothetical protein CVD27_20345 [Neobacillus cucumis]
MEGFKAFCFTILFAGYVYFLPRFLRQLFFLGKRRMTSTILLFLYIGLGPFMYSIFAVGSVSVIFLGLVGKMPFQGLIAILFLICGIFLCIIPIRHYFSKKTLEIAGFSAIFMVAGLILSLINPVWNDQLEQSLGIPMPSLGLFLVITNAVLLMVILYHFVQLKKAVKGNAKIE